jgi:rhamnosyltransferase subunit B
MRAEENALALDFLLPTLGSTGDVISVVCLGRGLVQRGHSATVVANEEYEESVQAAGLGFVPMGTRDEAQKLFADPRLWDLNKGFECIAERVIGPNVRRLYEVIDARRSENTVVAASPVCFGARIAQDRLGVPVATVHVQPSLLRSLVDSGRLGRIPMGPGVPRFLKAGLMALLDRHLIDKKLGPPVNSLRSELGLAPVEGLFRSYLHSPQLVLGLFPEWFAAPQPDWPLNVHLTGFVMDESQSAPLTQEADKFLASGPVVLFTAGSEAKLDAFFRESVEVARFAGVKALFVGKHRTPVFDQLPEHVQHAAWVSFPAVFPRCAAVVHHGGIGTFAHAVKAGIPQFVVPHAHDQPDHALRVERLALGRSLYPENYRAVRAATMLKELVESTAIRNRCREYGAQIDGTAAIEKACSLLESLGRA